MRAAVVSTWCFTENNILAARQLTQNMSNHTADAREQLADLPDGVGCTEIWEHLSEERGNSE